MLKRSTFLEPDRRIPFPISSLKPIGPIQQDITFEGGSQLNQEELL
jgi:hypothetical protein